ncbi:MAG: transporter substrate-binding domain-containing protein, partial [Planctomycetota bacterium]|nr:transporter substrate-binding domain-containing protein [Planctomycetota bacterium]
MSAGHLQIALLAALSLLPLVSASESGAESQAFLASLPEVHRNWLADQDVIRIAMDDGNPPMNFRDDDGALAGITVDYLRAIERRIGVRIECVGASWETALASAMAHKTDGIANAFDKPERRLKLDFTAPYLESPMALAMLAGAAAPNRIEDMDGKRIAVVAGTARVPLLQQLCPRATLIEARNLREALATVTKGDADALLDDLVVTSYTMEREFHAGLKIALLYYHEGLNESRFGLRNAAPSLLAVFDAAIKDITPDEHRAISGRWLREIESTQVQRSLHLTDEERRWLLEHPVIRVGTDPDREPMEAIDANGRPYGLAIDYLNEIEAMLGVRFSIQHNKTWAELVAMAQQRELDMFTSVSANIERSEYLTFSTNYSSQPAVLFGHRDLGWINDINELATSGHAIAVVEGYSIHDFLAREHPQVQLKLAVNINECMRLVRTGEAVAFADHSLVGSRHISDAGHADLAVVGETKFRFDQTFGVRKDWPILRNILNKALNNIPPEIKLEISDRWLRNPIAQRTDYGWLLWALFGIAIAALSALMWSWQLSSAVKARTRDLVASNTALAQQIEAREEAETRLAQAQKMDAIGQLAGGIAHDFNNMLGGIFGASELLSRRVKDDESSKECVDIIMRSGQRAAELTSKLLAFARKGKMVTTAIDLHLCLKETLTILERTIDKRIEIQSALEASSSMLIGDQALLQNAILNLAI